MMDEVEKRLKVTRFLAISCQKQPMPTAQVHRSKNDLSRRRSRTIEPQPLRRDEPSQHAAVETKANRSHLGPAPHIVLVRRAVGDEYGVFSLGLGQDRGHTDSVSKHSPSDARRGEWYRRKSVCCRHVRDGLARAARSS